MKGRFAVAMVLVCLGLAAACADGGDEEVRTEASETAIAASEGGLEEARAVAEQALLRLEDFPTGWVERPAEQDEEDFQPDLPRECQWFIQQEELPGTVVKVDSPEFHGPDHEEVESAVTVFVDVTAARQAFADVQDFIEGCRQPLRQAFTEYLQEKAREEVEDLVFEVTELTDFNIDKLSFPAHGDESMAFQVGFEVHVRPLSVDYYFDMFGIRVDRIVGVLTFGDSFVRPLSLERPDTNEEERLAGIIEERLHTAVAELE